LAQRNRKIQRPGGQADPDEVGVLHQITGVSRSYFNSLGSLIYFVVGFLGGTYALGNFIGSDASALRVSSCIGVNSYLVHDFFVCDVDSITFGGTMDFCTLAMYTNYSSLCSLRMFKQKRAFIIASHLLL